MTESVHPEPHEHDERPTRPERVLGPAPRWDPQAGEWIGGAYRVIREIGRGGVARVLEAWDATLSRRVALKVLRPELQDCAALRTALGAEARELAAIDSPRVVTVFGRGQHRGHPFVVMELVEGTNASLALASHAGTLPLARVATLLADVGEGLAAIHGSGLVHGDLKPTNVLVDAAGRAKLVDVAGTTNGTVVASTPAYLAPERREGGTATVASDLYAFGVTAFELLTGRLPRPEDRGASALRSVNERVDGCLARAMSPSPRDRPSSAAALGRELAHALGHPRRDSGRWPSAPRILVADDDVDLRELLAACLRAELPGSVIETAGDADSLLGHAMRSLPDAVVLDLVMPGTPTEETIRCVRSLEGGASVAILVMTGVGSASDWRALRAAGADSCLLKPFDVSELLAQLRRQMSARASGASLSDRGGGQRLP
jgi:serine/threonine protein kinase